jgi:hypothetical protein
MKKIWIPLFIIFLSSSFINSQSQIGIKLGLSSYDLPMDAIDLNNEELQLSVENANYGVHFGAYVRIGLLGFYIQPELNFNSNSVDYRIQDFDATEGTVDEIRTAHYQNIDIPVLIMFNPSIFRLFAGPVGHYFLDSSSELKSIKGLKEEFKTLTYGYHAGVGIQIGSLGIDLRYEGNFTKFGNQITLEGQPFEFSTTPSRIIASLAFKL